MSRYIFLFDFDSTIIKKELLPTILGKLGMHEKIEVLTESVIGEASFKQSFLQKVDLLKHIPVSEISEIVEGIELNDGLVKFIRNNKQRCYIITSNLDIWIDKLVKRIGMDGNVWCSKALVCNNYIEDVFSIVDKNAMVSQLIMPFVAVGGGNDDAEMIEAAEIGIGFERGQDIAFPVLECATHVIYDEKKLEEFLRRLL